MVYGDRQKLQEEVEDFIIQNTALLSQLKYDPVKLFPDVKQYNEFMELTHVKRFEELTRDQQFLSLLINKLNHNIPTPAQQLLSKNWLMDYDEMLLVDRSK